MLARALNAPSLERLMWPVGGFGFSILASNVASVGFIAISLIAALYGMYALACWMQKVSFEGRTLGELHPVKVETPGQFTLDENLRVGSHVKKGQRLGTLEVMKMISILYASNSGVITSLCPNLQNRCAILEKNATALTIRGGLVCDSL